MKARRKALLLAVLAALAVIATARADEYTWPEREIKFKRSDEAIPAAVARLDPMPKYVAVIAPGRGLLIRRWPDWPPGKVLSEQQEALLARRFSDAVVQASEGLRLYAVSEEDARRMATAVIEASDERNRRRFGAYVEHLHRQQSLIPDAEKTIAEGEPELKTITSRLEELRRVGYFRNRAEAEKIAADLGTLLNQIDIEIAGREAEVKVLTAKFGEPSIRVTESMREMHLEIEVDLAGALVRKKKAQDARARALEYVALSVRRSLLRTELEKAQSTLTAEAREKIAQQILELERGLAHPNEHMRPVVVRDNTVFIHPVIPLATTRPGSGAAAPKAE